MNPRVEAALAALHPGVPWSARNQARMHRRNGDSLYRDMADAVRCWPETATAIAARLRAGQVELLTPHGTEDLLGLVLRPSPVTARDARRMDAYRRRVRSKSWAERWPRLTVLELEE